MHSDRTAKNLTGTFSGVARDFYATARTFSPAIAFSEGIRHDGCGFLLLPVVLNSKEVTFSTELLTYNRYLEGGCYGKGAHDHSDGYPE